MKSKVFKKLALLLSTVMIFTFLFTACGDTEDTETPNEPTEEEESIDEDNVEDDVEEDEDFDAQEEDDELEGQDDERILLKTKTKTIGRCA